MKLEYYTATWCMPCKVFGPIMDEVAKEMDFDYFKITIDKDEWPIPDDVLGVPTVIMYQDGVEVDRITGARSKEDLQWWISSGGI